MATTELKRGRYQQVFVSYPPDTLSGMDNLTPMMRQYHQIKRKHPGLLVFFRLGDFYEMFYEDAVLASHELEITLTSRNNDRQGEPIPMCGVPYHALNGYLARLVKRGHKVAICEQVEDPRQAKGIVRREVTRIVTPGTATDEGLLEAKENNFIAGLSRRSDRVGIALMDVSTGEFWVAEFRGEEAWSQLEQEFYPFQPRELVVAEGGVESFNGSLSSILPEGAVVTAQPDWTFNSDYARRLLLSHFSVSTLAGFGLEEQEAGVSAAGALLNYLQQTQGSRLQHVTGIRLIESHQYMKLDPATVENLELIKGKEEGRRWTLLSALDFTRTAMGGRLLRSWLLRPSLDLEEIEQRQEAVEELHRSTLKIDQLGKILKPVQDVERLLGRVTLQTANARDLVALCRSLKALPSLSTELKTFSSRLLDSQIDLLEDVVHLLEASINAEPPLHLSDGGTIRSGYNEELDELRKMARSGKDFIARLESGERERTGISNLKVKYNKVFGYFIEVTKSNLDAVPQDYIRKQTLVGSERFITPELKEYEEKVLGAQERIGQLEAELFRVVREQVAQHSGRIGEAARTIARVDVLLSLAEAAQRHAYVRPSLDDGCSLTIRGGRHPVLERQGSDPFVPNDLTCNTTTDQLLILTGPNMGGKSTYLRQNALIVVMAQMGSFVPAEEAHVGLVDRIFTRVGASDNLARGRSTFMVEMIETANILNTASPRSLILLDEVGRGTATFDGLSIAWAVAEHLLSEPSCKARTLFATHYQELTKLEKVFEGVRNYCVTVKESGDEIIFFHRVMPGAASRSYGIEVARLAGLPAPVVSRARQVLKRLERRELDLTGGRAGRLDLMGEVQGSLF